MIEVLQGFPGNVVAVSAKGHVTQKDYHDVLIPKVKEALARHDRIRCYYELGAAFLGARWRRRVGGFQARYRASHALGAGGDGDRCGVDPAGGEFLPLPGSADIRVFAAAQASEARRWIAAA